MSQQPPPEPRDPWADQPPSGQPPVWGPGQPPYGQYPGYPPVQPYGDQPGYPYPYQPAGYGWFDPNDPLVTPPGTGIGGWTSRISATIQRSWRTLLPIIFITQALPGLVLAVFSTVSTARLEAVAASAEPDPAALVGPGVFIVVALLVALLAVFLSAIGWAAGTWAMAREAVGAPAGLGAALRYGMSRALGLGGWSLLMGLIIGVGICACVLPGIYLAFALSLAGPVYLFERTNPIGRAFSLFHSALGVVLGRVALLALVVVGGSFLIELVTSTFGVAVGVGTGITFGVVLVTLISTLLTLPLTVVQLVGLVTTYAERRGLEGPVNTGQLVTELG